MVLAINGAVMDLTPVVKVGVGRVVVEANSGAVILASYTSVGTCNVVVLASNGTVRTSGGNLFLSDQSTPRDSLDGEVMEAFIVEVKPVC